MGSGFHDFAAAEVLTAANVDGYLMRQTVMTFADATARNSALSGVLDEGMVTYQEDTNSVTYYTGAAWRTIYQPETAWTPSFTNLTVGNGVLAGNYSRSGDMVHASLILTWGTTTSIGGVVSTNLPVTGSTTTEAVGPAVWRDASATTSFIGQVIQSTGTVLGFHAHGAGQVNATAPFTWATSDAMRVSISYTAA